MSDCMNTMLYVTLYNHCVKPILSYGSEVWSVDFLINKSGETQMENRYVHHKNMSVCRPAYTQL